MRIGVLLIFSPEPKGGSCFSCLGSRKYILYWVIYATLLETSIFVESRQTLPKSTLSGLPTYYLSLFNIPQAVADRVEQIQRNFLWGLSEDVFKYPLIAWDKVCWLVEVEVGGLGIRKIGLFNQALFGICLWQFGREVNCLWR